MGDSALKDLISLTKEIKNKNNLYAIIIVTVSVIFIYLSLVLIYMRGLDDGDYKNDNINDTIEFDRYY